MREGWRSESLLVRQMGIYRIKLNELQKPIYFQIMENVHKGLHQMGAGFKADLKGSHNTGNGTNEGLRDRDLRNYLREGRVQFELADPASFKQKLRDDCEMLSEVGLMDYSLMLWAIKTESVAVEETKLKIEDWASVMQHTTKYIQTMEEELKGEEKLATQIVQVIEELKRSEHELLTAVEAAGLHLSELDEMEEVAPNPNPNPNPNPDWRRKPPFVQATSRE